MAIVKKLGFAGVGLIDNQQVLITGGSFNKDNSIPYIQPLSIPKPEGKAGGASRTRVQYADGTVSFTGSINFDVNAPSMSLLTLDRLLKRGFRYPIVVFDGETGFTLENCYTTSLGVSASAGGMISCDLSFISKDDWQPQYNAAEGIFIRPENPIGYWASGNTNVVDWSLSFNQVAEPVFLNQKQRGGSPKEDDRWPRYIKIGTTDYSLNVTTYEEVLTHDKISVYTSAFKLIGKSASEGYTFGGATSLGTFTHSFEASVPLTDPDGSGALVIENVASIGVTP